MRIVINVKEQAGGKIALVPRLDPSSTDTKRERVSGEVLFGHLGTVFAELEKEQAAPAAPVRPTWRQCIGNSLKRLLRCKP